MLKEQNFRNFYTDKRRTIIMQIAVFVRTYINIPNRLSSNAYSITQLNEIIDRRTFLRRLLMTQQELLQGVHNQLV